MGELLKNGEKKLLIMIFDSYLFDHLDRILRNIIRVQKQNE